MGRKLARGGIEKVAPLHRPARPDETVGIPRTVDRPPTALEIDRAFGAADMLADLAGIALNLALPVFVFSDRLWFLAQWRKDGSLPDPLPAPYLPPAGKSFPRRARRLAAELRKTRMETDEALRRRS